MSDFGYSYGDEAEYKSKQLIDELQGLSNDNPAEQIRARITGTFDGIFSATEKLSFLHEILASNKIPTTMHSAVLHAITASAINMRSNLDPNVLRAEFNNIVLHHSLYENQKLEAAQDTESFIGKVIDENVLLKFYSNCITWRNGACLENISVYEQKFCNAIAKLPDQEFWSKSQILLSKGALRPQGAALLSNTVMARLLRMDKSADTKSFKDAFLLPSERDEHEREECEMEASKNNVIKNMATLAYAQQETSHMWENLQLARTMSTEYGTMDAESVSERLLALKGEQKTNQTKYETIDILRQTIAQQQKIEELRHTAFEQGLLSLLKPADATTENTAQNTQAQKPGKSIDAYSAEDFLLWQTIQQKLRDAEIKDLESQSEKTSGVDKSLPMEEGFAVDYIANRSLMLHTIIKADKTHEHTMQTPDQWQRADKNKLPLAKYSLN